MPYTIETLLTSQQKNYVMSNESGNILQAPPTEIQSNIEQKIILKGKNIHPSKQTKADLVKMHMGLSEQLRIQWEKCGRDNGTRLVRLQLMRNGFFLVLLKFGQK